MRETLEEFKKYREKMNEKILASGNQQIQRFFNLDTRAYEPGALPSKTKELLGLVASVVLRCDDCVTYHVIRCTEEGGDFLRILRGTERSSRRWRLNHHPTHKTRSPAPRRMRRP